jgi:hypothetical protein
MKSEKQLLRARNHSRFVVFGEGVKEGFRKE